MMTFNAIFTHMANAVSKWAGHPTVFIAAGAIVLIWAVSGPVFDYSNTWQLVINTGTTIITFLMVFLIQNTQNRDNAALHSKLDEMIRASEAKNKFIGIETLPEEKIVEMHERVKVEADVVAKIAGEQRQ
jgi:low affinity Fe/Cu permease